MAFSFFDSVRISFVLLFSIVECLKNDVATRRWSVDEDSRRGPDEREWKRRIYHLLYSSTRCHWHWAWALGLGMRKTFNAGIPTMGLNGLKWFFGLVSFACSRTFFFSCEEVMKNYLECIKSAIKMEIFESMN